jgi:hypothetical protein
VSGGVADRHPGSAREAGGQLGTDRSAEPTGPRGPVAGVLLQPPAADLLGPHRQEPALLGGLVGPVGRPAFDDDPPIRSGVTPDLDDAQGRRETRPVDLGGDSDVDAEVGERPPQGAIATRAQALSEKPDKSRSLSIMPTNQNSGKSRFTPSPA